MNINIDDFENNILEQVEKRRLQNFDDLQNEMGGNEVGRIMRFLSADAQANLSEKKIGKNANGLSALDIILLSNHEYYEAYEGAMNTLEKAESATERALDKLEIRVERAKTDLQSTLHKAAELSDGTLVFLDKDNKFRSENGEIIDDELAAKVELQGTEPAYETYLAQKSLLHALENSIYEVRVYQTDVLGNARSDLTDTNNPKSIEEIEAIENDVQQRMLEAVRSELQQETMEQKISNSKSFTVSEPVI